MFVDGVLLAPVLSEDALEPGSFYVDEANDTIALFPPAGTNMAKALVEVSVRPRGIDIGAEKNIAIRGFKIQHFATPWKLGLSAVRFYKGSDGGIVEDSEIVWNNYVGFSVTASQDTTVRRVRMNSNGLHGFAAWRSRGLTITDSESSFNNWRGEWGGHTGWSPSNKVMQMRDFTIRNHDAIGNRGRGLWLDDDNENVLIENVECRDNLKDGLFVEATQGPVTIRNSRFSDNGEWGIRINNSSNGVLAGNQIEIAATTRDEDAGEQETLA